MVKKIIALVLALVMVFALAACGEKPADPAPAPGPAAPADPAAPAEKSAKEIAEEAGYDYTKVDTSDWKTLDLSYAAYLPAGNPISDMLFNSLADACEKLMPGYINMTLFPSGTLVGQDDMLEGIADGVADLGMLEVGTVVSMLPVTAMWGAGCFKTTSTTACTAAMMEWLQNNYDLPEFEANNIVPLGIQGSAANQLCTTKEWQTLDDIKGMQCCVPGVYAPMLKAMGTVPVSMETSELYEASRSGLVEGAFYTLGMNYLCGSQEFLKRVCVTGYGGSAYLIPINADIFYSLPPIQQEFLREAGRQAIWETVMPWMPANGDMLEPSLWCIQDTDYAVFELPQETMDAIAAVVAPLRQEYLDSVKAEHPEIVEQTAEMERYSEKWSEWYPISRYLEPIQFAMDGKFAEFMENVNEYCKLPEFPEIEGYVPVAQR